MISRHSVLGFWIGCLLFGLTGCGPALPPTPSIVDNSRCKITSLTLNAIPTTGDTIKLKPGSKAAFYVEGETVGIYAFPSKKLRLVKPPAGSKAGAKTKYLMMELYARFVRAGSDDEDIEESYCNSSGSIDTVVDCDERSFSWNQKIEVPSRPGSYEFRITAYWINEPEVDSGKPETVEPGVAFTPKSHVLGTWKAIVE